MTEGADLVIYGRKGVNIFPGPEWFAAINPAKRIPVLRDRAHRRRGRPWHDPRIVGEAFSIADIAAATQFVNLRLAGGSVDAARWPKPAACIEDESRLFPQGDYEL